MLKNIACLAGGAGLCLALAAASSSWAGELPAPPTSASVQAPAISLNPIPFPIPELKPGQMADATLARLDGRGDPAATVITSATDQDLTAVNSGNSIIAGTVGSGAISLQGNAFSAFNGVGNILMNTGHNNNLQSTMSVTVIIGP